MRSLLAVAFAPIVLLSGCARQAPQWDGLPTRTTPAVAQATEQHASVLARAVDAGLWVAQDADGKLIASGVLDPMPTSFASDELYAVFPRQTGQRVQKFGFARTVLRARRGGVPIIFAEYAAAP
jgi:hypothetical protein